MPSSRELKNAALQEEEQLLAESAAKRAAELREMTELPPRFAGFFTTSAALVAALAAAFFADRWHMRTQADIGVLALVGGAVFAALRDAYAHQAAAAAERACERLSAASAGAQSTEQQRRACAEEGGFYALFVVNFWFLAVFAALALVAAPLALGSTASFASTPAGEPILAAWYHAAGSALPAALLVVLSARRII